MSNVYYYNLITKVEGYKYKVKGKTYKQKFVYIKNEDIEPKTYCISSNGIVTTERGTVVRMMTQSDGYKYVVLNTVTGPRRYLLHKLVKDAFGKQTNIDVTLGRNLVHFKDWNKKNCIHENLMYVNRRELLLRQQIRRLDNPDRESLEPFIIKLMGYDIPYTNKMIKELIDIPGSFVDQYLNSLRFKL